jgi:hypothetical protein
VEKISTLISIVVVPTPLRLHQKILKDDHGSSHAGKILEEQERRERERRSERGTHHNTPQKE